MVSCRPASDQSIARMIITTHGGGGGYSDKADAAKLKSRLVSITIANTTSQLSSTMTAHIASRIYINGS